MSALLDRIKEPFVALVRSVFPRIDYLALYPGTVVLQRGPNAIDVQCDDPRLPGFASIPLFLGEPSAVVQVQAGARILVGFQGGDPRYPFAALWGNGAVVQSLSFAGGGHAAARVGDPVKLALSDLQQFVFTAPPTGGPCTVTGGIVGTPATQVSAGSSKVQLG